MIFRQWTAGLAPSDIVSCLPSSLTPKYHLWYLCSRWQLCYQCWWWYYSLWPEQLDTWFGEEVWPLGPAENISPPIWRFSCLSMPIHNWIQTFDWYCDDHADPDESWTSCCRCYGGTALFLQPRHIAEDYAEASENAPDNNRECAFGDNNQPTDDATRSYRAWSMMSQCLRYRLG